MTEWQGRVGRVVDGDTLDVHGTPPGEAQPRDVRVRIVGIDAPEMPTWRGRRSRARLRRLCPAGAVARVQPVEDQDPYGRQLAHVWIDAGQTQLLARFARRWR